MAKRAQIGYAGPDQPINHKLWDIWQGYRAYCFTLGIRPAEYEKWKLIVDSSYKLAGI